MWCCVLTYRDAHMLYNSVEQCIRQRTLERQDLPCTYLTHFDLDSVNLINTFTISITRLTLFLYMQAALKYTDTQEQDILHLRRLFYSKLGQLARQRAALLRKVPGAGSDMLHHKPVTFNHGYQHVADKLIETTEVAERLCANRHEESQAYMYCGFCLFRCVSLSNLTALPRNHRVCNTCRQPSACLLGCNHAFSIHSRVSMFCCTTHLGLSFWSPYISIWGST